MSARIIVHSLDQARAACAAAAALDLPVTLQSAPGAGAAAGPRWFLALVAAAARDCPAARTDAVLDCADEAGTVLAALRAGCARVIFTGDAEPRARLAEIAAALGAQIEAPGDSAALDLLDHRDPQTACRAYLAAGEGGTDPSEAR